MNEIVIQVKTTHISQGKQADAWCCPIALAIKEKYNTELVWVGIEITIVNGENYQTPKNAQKFINSFDKRNKVKPATFRFKK